MLFGNGSSSLAIAKLMVISPTFYDHPINVAKDCLLEFLCIFPSSLMIYNF